MHEFSDHYTSVAIITLARSDLPDAMVKPRTSAAQATERTVISVIGICGRAANGESRPWLVEGADGHFYFLKRDNLSRDRLVTEYLVSRLAEECGLPVPPVQLLSLPAELIRHCAVDGARELTPGIAFGSLRVSFAEEIRSAHLRSIEEETKLRCLCFDWWTENPDRALDRIGGDPNVLWDPVLQQIFLIDHDRSLAPSFDSAAFLREHVFRDERPFLEKAFLSRWRTRFESAVYHLAGIWDEMPGEWHTGPGKKKRLSFTRQEVEARLMKPKLPVEGLLVN